MPQMAPLSWLSMYIFFSALFMMIPMYSWVFSQFYCH